jgi:hypothetical protein
MLLPILGGLSVAEEPPPIQDNSFLLEEAYNQEKGVVQHISSLTGLEENRDWIYTFTQEWPLMGQKHQLSYTVPFLNPGEEEPGDAGLGDLILNYRYQAVGSGETKVAFAPRLSLWLPTGNDRLLRSSGSTGVQVNLPLSVQLSRQFVAHSNAGALYTPSTRDATGNEADTTIYNLGQSLVWLARPTFNVLAEAVWISFEEVTGPGQTSRSSAFLLNPGVRWAYNFPSGLQIVPGVSAPIGLGASYGDWGLLLYLSFEHKFGKAGSGRE